MAFAAVDDVEARLGRELTDGETASVEFLLDGATSMIAAALGRTDEWATNYAAMTDPDPPAVLRFTSVEMVCRAMANPQGLKSLSESLGQASYTAQFRDEQAGSLIALTKTEELLLRRAVYGTTQASPRTESVLDDLNRSIGS